MYDTAKRVTLVKKRVRENIRRKQRREVGSLSAVCLLLFAALLQTASMVIQQGPTATQGVFGAMLLREDAGGYVLVGVVCFTLATVITALCFRLRNKAEEKSSGTITPARHEQGGNNQ
mgnify:CR=1 FL=1